MWVGCKAGPGVGWGNNSRILAAKATKQAWQGYKNRESMMAGCWRCMPHFRHCLQANLVQYVWALPLCIQPCLPANSPFPAGAPSNFWQQANHP
jgi:hypothetical protein